MKLLNSKARCLFSSSSLWLHPYMGGLFEHWHGGDLAVLLVVLIVEQTCLFLLLKVEIIIVAVHLSLIDVIHVCLFEPGEARPWSPSPTCGRLSFPPIAPLSFNSFLQAPVSIILWLSPPLCSPLATSAALNRLPHLRLVVICQLLLARVTMPVTSGNCSKTKATDVGNLEVTVIADE